MALPLVCVAPSVVQQDKSNLTAIGPGWAAWAASDGRLTDRKVYGFDVGIKGDHKFRLEPSQGIDEDALPVASGRDFSHPTDTLLI